MNRRGGGLLLPAATLLFVACTGGGDGRPGDGGGAAQTGEGGVIVISAQESEFNTDRIVLPAGEAVTIQFRNHDAVPHNIAIYRDSSTTEEIFVGETISGPDETVFYELTALEPGTYHFQCDVHPEMNGEVIVE